jgi:lysozyme
LIQRWEGFRTKAYQCSAGVWTVGYGATGPDIKEGVVWTQEQAIEDLKNRTAVLTYRICSAADARGRQLTQGQLDALTSFAYNLGIGALLGSTLWKLFLKGDVAGALAEFPKWKHVKNKVEAGLVARRKEEAAVFRGP